MLKGKPLNCGPFSCGSNTYTVQCTALRYRPLRRPVTATQLPVTLKWRLAQEQSFNGPHSQAISDLSPQPWPVFMLLLVVHWQASGFYRIKEPVLFVSSRKKHLPSLAISFRGIKHCQNEFTNWQHTFPPHSPNGFVKGCKWRHSSIPLWSHPGDEVFLS